MRMFMVALMIALLPLRGWLGDAMAAQDLRKAVQHETVHETAHAMAWTESSPEASGHANCHEMGAAAAVTAGSDLQAHPADAGASDDAERCSACQLCHSTVLASSSRLLVTQRLPLAPPVSATLHFASAEPVRGFKPPIATL